LSVDYAQAGKVKKELSNSGYLLKSVTYLDQVVMTVQILPEDRDALFALVADMTSGQGILVAGTDEYLNPTS